MHIEPTRPELARLPWRWLDRLRSSVLVSDGEHRLLATNEAWFEFARSNGGEAVLERFPLGSCWMEAVRGEGLRARLDAALRDVLQTGRPWDFEYECSSPQVERRFRLRAHAVLGRRALLLVHSPTFVGEAGRVCPELCDDNGILTFCLACGRVSVRGRPDEWVHAPGLDQRLPPNASASLCPVCFELAPAGLFAPRA